MPTFENVPVDSIIINRDERQRKAIEKIDEMMDSISRLGLINPIVVTRDLVLVAGERRLTAVRALGWTDIPAQFLDTLDPLTQHLIELEENIKRMDLPWQDETAAIAEYHRLQSEQMPGWTQDDTASAVGLSQRMVWNHLQIHEAIKRGVPGVAEAERYSIAKGLVDRANERLKTTTILQVEAPPLVLKTPEGSVLVAPPTPEKPVRRISLLNQSFLDFESEIKFNFIHCDFPYGVSAGDTQGQSGAKFLGSYEDSPDIYFALLRKLVTANFIEDSAHLMFWYGMQFHDETVRVLRKAGWRVHHFPLIWLKSDNTGILADKDRWPRHIYETALIASRGDRKIVRAVGDAVAGPTSMKYHMSEKPKAILEHFFRMFVDSSTIMLDPTAGSANALIVAEERGAQLAIGLEMNEEFYTRALENIAANG